MAGALPLVRVGARTFPVLARSIWHAESYTLQTQLEYPNDGLEAAGAPAMLSTAIEHQFGLATRNAYRVVVGDLNFDFDADGCLRSLDVFTNPVQWTAETLPPSDGKSEAITLAMDTELDKNRLSHWPVSMEFLWSEWDRRLLLRFNDHEKTVRRYSVADTVSILVAQEAYLTAVEFTNVLMEGAYGGT